jgi:hypothetical protein
MREMCCKAVVCRAQWLIMPDTGLLSRGSRKVHPMMQLISHLWQALVRREWLVFIAVIFATQYRALVAGAFFLLGPRTVSTSAFLLKTTSVLPNQGSAENSWGFRRKLWKK